MKRNYLLIVVAFIFFAGNGIAQPPNWNWAKSAGGTSDDDVYSITTDASGNILVAGFFQSPTITFDTITLINVGNSWNIFLVKYDPSGNALWAKNANGNGSNTYPISVTTDASSNIYLAGSFSSPTTTFGSIILTNTSGIFSDLFLAKFDSAGNEIWAKSAGGISYDEASSVTTDASGAVYVSGWFHSSSITFGSTTLSNSGGEDLFIAKFDTAGNSLWAKRAGGTDYDLVNSIATDPSGNIYLAGNFWSSSIAFGLTTLTNNGDYDTFIAKYDSAGNALWAKKAGGTYGDGVYSVTTDVLGNAYVAGIFRSPSITFGAYTLTNDTTNTTPDMFLAKYASNGNTLWARDMGGTNWDFASSVAADVLGHVYVSGYALSASITFGSYTITNVSGYDNFIAKYDTSGNVQWVKSFGAGDFSFVTIDVSGNIFLTGVFSQSIILAPTILTSIGGMDIFITKLDTAMVSGNINVSTSTNMTSFYPNPAIDLFTLALGRINKTIDVTISDITGNIVYRTNTINAQKIEVSTKDFPEGIYIVQTQTPDFIETRKLIIAK